MNPEQPSQAHSDNTNVSVPRTSVADFAEFNANLIDAGCALLSRLEDSQYSTTIDSLSDSTIGGHVRHCLDFYDALLRGVDCGTVDYDARPREALIENDRRTAIARLEAVRDRMLTLAYGSATPAVSVRITAPDGRADVVPSSLPRELETAANHTIHHYAIIAIFARARGIDVDHSFGVALSTRRYRDAQSADRR